MPIAKRFQAAAAAAAPPLKPKTAVVVIHGMGEQKPMQTLWRLVSALWIDDVEIPLHDREKVYSKPEFITESFELRRITTRGTDLEAEDKRVDFFELYWAHLMTGNTVRSLTGWLRNLLVRRPSSVPSRLRGPWLFALVVFLAIVITMTVASSASWLGKLPIVKGLSIAAILLGATIVAGVIGYLMRGWFTPVLGDAARYLSATPDNVAARQKIRESGLALLDGLHASGAYDRIVVVGHSLGAVVGYDVLNYAWGRLDHGAMLARHGKGSDCLEALRTLENAAGALKYAKLEEVGALRKAYRAAQRAYFLALRAAALPAGAQWAVSDFVTLGCPLSKADVLLARDAGVLEILKERREVPTCPPKFEVDQPSGPAFSFSFPGKPPSQPRAPHHGAVFAPVVWTNIYFDNFLFFFGDIISGPVASLLGQGVLDVRLRIGAPVFRHLHYWKAPDSEPPRPWLKALRRAVNLKMKDDDTLWGAQATSAQVEAEQLPDPTPAPDR